MVWLLAAVTLVGLVVLLGLWSLAAWRRSVRQEVLAVLREQHPDVKVVRETQSALELRFPDGSSGTLVLLNLYSGLAGGPRDGEPRQEAIRAFVTGALSGLQEARQPLSLATHGERLMPRLGIAAFVSEAAAQGKPILSRPTSLPGLVTLYVLDSEQSVEYLGEERLLQLGLDEDGLHERAMANLRRHSIAETVRGVLVDRRLAVVKLADSYDATRLLLVPEALADGEELVALVPDRETLALLPLPPDGAWGPIRKLARTPASPYRLLDTPVRVTRVGFTLA